MNHSLYVHIPFCTHRCAYCDFNTYAGQEDSIPGYVEALCREIEFVGATAAERIRIHTAYFGGGTPSLLSPRHFEDILSAIHCHFDLAEGAEITMEANPGTVSRAGLRELRELGINRISFGAQSANSEELRMLERAHSFLDVIKAVEAARWAGFDNLNLDLIYGLPEQVLASWQATVGRVLALHPEHVSAYALTLEHGTPFGRWASRGLLPVPDPDAAAEMYEWASEALEAAGYVQYEISNWAKDGGELSAVNSRRPAAGHQPRYSCRHNLQYWRCLPYLGLGAGAHGYVNRYRCSNVLRIKTYIERMKDKHTWSMQTGFPFSPAVVNQHRQTPEDEMSEFMITGLRLTREGIPSSVFRERFRRGLMEVYGPEVVELIHLGLLECVNETTSEAGEASEVMRLTRRGRLLGNQVFMRFV